MSVKKEVNVKMEDSKVEDVKIEEVPVKDEEEDERAQMDKEVRKRRSIMFSTLAIKMMQEQDSQ